MTHTDGNGRVHGNLGVYDMVMALQWVHDNIRHFGGDPHRVTIMGESAGGAAVSLLAVSPLTQRLVNNAIVMSGSAMAAWALLRPYETSKYDMNELIRYVRCDKLVSKEDVSAH